MSTLFHALAYYLCLVFGSISSSFSMIQERLFEFRKFKPIKRQLITIRLDIFSVAQI